MGAPAGGPGLARGHAVLAVIGHRPLDMTPLTAAPHQQRRPSQRVLEQSLSGGDRPSNKGLTRDQAQPVPTAVLSRRLQRNTTGDGRANDRRSDDFILVLEHSCPGQTGRRAPTAPRSKPR